VISSVVRSPNGMFCDRPRAASADVARLSWFYARQRRKENVHPSGSYVVLLCGSDPGIFVGDEMEVLFAHL